MPVAIKSTGGGSVTLTAPSTASDLTLTLPSATGTVATTTGTLTNPTINGFTGDTSVINVGSGQIYKDTSGNVGIGTSSPTAISNYTSLCVNNATTGGIVDLMQGGAYKLRLIGTASAGQIETASSLPIVFAPAGTERARIDASGNWYMNSGYGSAAVAYGCRAWVNYNATTSTVRGSGNISSVTKNATGDFTLNFSSAMPDGNFGVSVATTMIPGVNWVFGTANINSSGSTVQANTTTTFRFSTTGPAGGAYDTQYVYATIFR